MNNLQRLSLKNPITVGLTILTVSFLLRILDIFILRMDERLGEIILSKSLGFTLILLFLLGTGQGLKNIGLHSTALTPSLLIGTLVTIFALAAGYVLEYALTFRQGLHPKLFVAAIDPKANAAGGILFGIWLITGNVVNSFMEEGLFRGVLIRLFSRRMAMKQANWLQSLLFGAWHLPWVVKLQQAGRLRNAGELAFGAISNFLPQFFMGLVWGYMYISTNSLWTALISHTLTNTCVNMLHIKTDEGIDSGIAVRMSAYVVFMLLGLFAVKHLAKRFGTRQVKPWELF